MHGDKRRSELFHVCVITNHTKIDTLFDSGSQVNLISEEVVKKLHLVTMPHENPILLVGLLMIHNYKLQRNVY